MSRVLENATNQITQSYSNSHQAVDLVKKPGLLCNVIAHSSGTVVWLQTGQKNNKNSTGNASYGNCVKIKHNNGYFTLYAHLETVDVKLNQSVSRGQIIGYMGNTGNSYGGHLHFEVRNSSDVRINPTNYLDADLPGSKPIVSTKYKVGDVVNINGVYTSSTSTKKLTPAITKGKITKIVSGANNPYLLDNGNIGWINDKCIVTSEEKFNLGDIVQPTKRVDVYGRTLVQYDNKYVIKAISGNSATLYAVRDGNYYIWATLPFDNIKKVG